MRIACLLLLTAVAACGDPAAEAFDAAPSLDAAPGAAVIATVQVREYERLLGEAPDPFETQRYATVTASFGDVALPSVRTVAQTAGACELTTYTPQLCDPACGTDATCVPPGVCAPNPVPGSVGVITFGGLAAPLTVAPDPAGAYFVFEPLADDLFADDTTVTLAAPGATYPAVALAAPGVAPMVAAITDGEIELVPGQDHTVAWTPSNDPDARVRLELRSNNTGHGQPLHAIITCDAPDAAGQIAVPAAMIDAFPATERWAGIGCPQADCPASLISRYRDDRAAFADGVARLEIASTYGFGVLHQP